MENFNFDPNENPPENKIVKKEDSPLNMQVSPICMKNGEKTAYVTFSDGKRHAEGEIPKCVILKSEGFSKDELFALEEYMEENLNMLKSMAASVNPIKAMMRED
ncbi:MAG: hypothetical protein K5675_09665 [Lachnospiraceae bacterium]|nr:hypothetical protein [Lachnospiraceae bacterium]